MLRLRLILVVACIAAGVLVGAGTLRGVLREQAEINLAARAAEVRSAALPLVASLARSLGESDDAATRRTVRAWMDGHGGVRRAIVTDLCGRVVAAEDQAGSVSRRPRGEWDREIGRAITASVRDVDPTVPISVTPGVMAGRLSLVLDREWAAAMTGTLLRTGVVAGATVLGASALAATLLMLWATRSLERMRGSIRVLADDGGVGETIRPLAERWPVAGLCRDFNALLGRVGRLSESEREALNIMQSMADCLIVVDPQAKIRRVNRAALELLGYREDELLGRTASLVCEAEGHALTPSQLEAFLGAGEKKDQEVMFITKGPPERRVPVSLSGSAIRDGKGRTTGYVCIGTDITARKEAEAERERLHQQLVTSSRHAGMAVVATGVLHNVGNVLNSVNVSASVVEESLKTSRVDRLGQAVAMLEGKATDPPALAEFLSRDEKGKMLPAYLGKLAAHLASEQTRMLDEVAALCRHVGHIRDIISVQQSTARSSGVVEPVRVADIAEDALRVICGSVERHQIDLVRAFEELPAAVTDRHKLLQILVNLLGNAVDAVKAVAHRRNGRIEVRIRREGEDGQAVEVRDNGVGIAPENLERVFTHGFTTKKDGHGFGLHSAALAAKELGGSLAAASEGEGTGAAFTLVIPREIPQGVRAA